jgi:thermostable 8-oxoguanine DNA glycosylase
VEEKYIRNEHLVDNIAEELVIILGSFDLDICEEDEDNSLEGILTLWPD